MLLSSFQSTRRLTNLATSHSQLFDERLQIRPTPYVDPFVLQGGRKRGAILVNIHEHYRLFLVIGTLDLPEQAVGFGGVLRDQTDEAVATFNARPAVRFPFLIPWFLGAHVGEI